MRTSIRLDIIKENGMWKYKLVGNIEGLPSLDNGPYAVKEELRKVIMPDNYIRCGVIDGDDLYKWLISK